AATATTRPTPSWPTDRSPAAAMFVLGVRPLLPEMPQAPAEGEHPERRPNVTGGQCDHAPGAGEQNDGAGRPHVPHHLRESVPPTFPDQPPDLEHSKRTEGGDRPLHPTRRGDPMSRRLESEHHRQ